MLDYPVEKCSNFGFNVFVGITGEVRVLQVIVTQKSITVQTPSKHAIYYSNTRNSVNDNVKNYLSSSTWEKFDLLENFSLLIEINVGCVSGVFPKILNQSYFIIFRIFAKNIEKEKKAVSIFFLCFDAG